MFQDALQFFENEKYTSARKEFESLMKSASETRTKQKAQFGVACSALAGAQTRSEIDSAFSLFEEWANAAPACLNSEDPRLLYPVLQEYNEKLSSTMAVQKSHCDGLKKRIQKLQVENKGLEEKYKDVRKEKKMLEEKIRALDEMQSELRKMRQETATENNETRIK
jgi:predicted RNase H-like nuclease (RuvC/YqgF family)